MRGRELVSLHQNFPGPRLIGHLLLYAAGTKYSRETTQSKTVVWRFCRCCSYSSLEHFITTHIHSLYIPSTNLLVGTVATILHAFAKANLGYNAWSRAQSSVFLCMYCTKTLTEGQIGGEIPLTLTRCSPSLIPWLRDDFCMQEDTSFCHSRKYITGAAPGNSALGTPTSPYLLLAVDLGRYSLPCNSISITVCYYICYILVLSLAHNLYSLIIFGLLLNECSMGYN